VHLAYLVRIESGTSIVVEKTSFWSITAVHGLARMGNSEIFCRCAAFRFGSDAAARCASYAAAAVGAAICSGMIKANFDDAGGANCRR
jgi:hypothetical protein